MQRWLFAGASSKRDLVMYCCRILALSGSRVLLADWTEGNSYRYLTRSGNEDLPVTEYNGFDICRYGNMLEQDLYDYCMYDIGTPENECSGLLDMADKIVWITSPDVCEAERSLDWLRTVSARQHRLQEKEIQAVFIRSVGPSGVHPSVLQVMNELPVAWRNKGITMPWNESDEEVRIEDELAGTLRINRISRAYKKVLLHLLGEMNGWSRPEAKRALRRAERRSA